MSDPDVIRTVRLHLDAADAQLPAEVIYALQRSRNQALASHSRRRHPFARGALRWLMPALPALAVLTLGLQLPKAPEANPLADDLQILLGDADPALLHDLDLLLWMAEQQPVAARTP